MRTSDLDPKDYKYIVEKPSKDFSPHKNKAIIDQTIKETEQYFKNEGKIIDDALGERLDILSTYGNKRLSGQTQMSFKDYVGRDLYAKVIGEKILSKVRVAESINQINGNTKFKKGILL